MAQTPQAEDTGVAGETTPPGTEQPQGFFGNSTTILLLIFAAAVFWWSRRRRAAMEERLQLQRREAEETAERSARDVAHVMRQTASPAAAAAAATEGLASAARVPEIPRVGQDARPDSEATQSGTADTGIGVEMTDVATPDDARALAIERAEASAAAERAAEEQAERAAHDAKLAGESETRRMAAAEAAAEEARADTADAQYIGAAVIPPNQEPDAAEVLREAMRELDNERDVPLGAIAGDGTATCPPEFPVKGNGQSRIYHEPGQGSYAQTVAEFCFASAEAADAAGFRQSRARGLRAQE